jgi:hypothetical protein
VGDAAYLLDPLTGEGIYYAVRSGMLAAEVILQSKEKGDLPAIDRGAASGSPGLALSLCLCDAMLEGEGAVFQRDSD